MITREPAGTLLTDAGPEIGVAFTKAFTSQLTPLVILGMYLGQVRGTLEPQESCGLIEGLALIPGKLEQILASSEVYDEPVRHLFRAQDFLYLGRGIHFPLRWKVL